MHTAEMPFQVRLATDERDLLGAQRLRYRVFVEELGGDGPLVDHAALLPGEALVVRGLVMPDSQDLYRL